MSHDRGCFKCGDDLPPRKTGCSRTDCPYRPKTAGDDVAGVPGVTVIVHSSGLLREALKKSEKLVADSIRKALRDAVAEGHLGPRKPLLSIPAQKLWKNVQKSERFYPWTPKPSKYMQELIDAGLVVTSGRVIKMGSFFTPKGVKPFTVEEFPETD